MKKIIIMAALALTMGFVSCGKTTPEEKAREMADKAVEALKSMDFDKLQALQDEETKYLETLSEEDKAIYNEALEKYSQELLGDMLGGLDDAEASLNDAAEALDDAAEAVENLHLADLDAE